MRTILVIAAIFLSLSIHCQNFPIGNRSFNFNDPARSRAVTGMVYYPATANGANTAVANGEFPVVVFGHGFGISITEYDLWWNELVPCGYIMVFPDTEGGVFPFPNHTDFAADMAFLVDEYLDEGFQNTSSPFYNKMNGYAGIMGHSMGGGCTYLAGAGNFNVQTIVTLAAADTSPSSVAAASGINIPSLTVAGSADCVVNAGGAPIDHYNNIPAVPEYKAYIDIINGSHCQFSKNSTGSICSLGEFCSSFISPASQHAQMFDAVKPWLDYHLREMPCSFDIFYNYATGNQGSLHTFQEMGTPITVVPLVPTSSNVTDTTADIAWSSIPGAINCKIEYREVGTTTWMSMTSTTSPITITGLNPNTTYQYRKSVDCGNGFQSAYSPNGTFTSTSTSCPPTLTIPTVPTANSIYQAGLWIQSTATVNATADITFHAGDYVLLNNNFTVLPNATFCAYILGCSP